MVTIAPLISDRESIRNDEKNWKFPPSMSNIFRQSSDEERHGYSTSAP